MVIPGVASLVIMRGLVALIICCGLLAVVAAKPSKLDILRALERALENETPDDTNTGMKKPGDTNTGMKKPGDTNTGMKKPDDTKTGMKKPDDTNTDMMKPDMNGLDEATLGTLWAINVEVTELEAKCEAWVEFVEQDWVVASKTGGLSIVCPALHKSFEEHGDAGLTAAEKQAVDEYFLQNLHQAYQAMACTNLFITFEGLIKKRCGTTESGVLHSAQELIDDCMAVFGGEKETEDEAAQELNDAQKQADEAQAKVDMEAAKAKADMEAAEAAKAKEDMEAAEAKAKVEAKSAKGDGQPSKKQELDRELVVVKKMLNLVTRAHAHFRK